MHGFLKLFQQSRFPTLLTWRLRELAGSDVVDALLRAQILRPAPPNPRRGDPCPGRQIGCGRWIALQRGLVPPQDQLGACQAAPCLRFPFNEENLSELSAPLDLFASWLRRVMRLDGAFQLLDDVYPDVVLLGELRGHGAARDVFWALDQWGTEWCRLVAERWMHARPCVVFVPTALDVPHDISNRCTPGSHVVLGYLADVLAVVDGEPVLLPTFAELFHHRTPAVQPPDSSPFCNVYAHTGRGVISADEYRTIVNGADGFDLFVDCAAPMRGRTCVGGARRPGQPFCRVELKALEALCLAEIVATAAPIRPRDIQCLRAAQISFPAKVVEAARRKIDVPLARHSWRAISTLGVTLSERRYQFRPPPTLKYAVLTPLSLARSGQEMAAGGDRSKKTRV